MKTLLCNVIVLALLISLSVVCYGQEADDAREADHQMLKALRLKITKGINTRDVDVLMTCLTKPFVLTFVDQTTITTEEELRDYIKGMFDGPDALLDDMKIEPEPAVKTQFIDENTGYCYGPTVETYQLKQGITSVLNGRWTATMVKKDGEWRVAAAHAGVNLMDNPLLHRTISAGRTLALIGTVAGLVVGLLAMWLLKRGKGQ